MTTHLRAAASEITEDLSGVQRAAPHPGAAFTGLLAAARREPSSSAAQRALIGAAFAVASGCETCANRYAREAAQSPVDRTALKLALQRGVLMAKRPASLVAAQALAEFDARRRSGSRAAVAPILSAETNRRPAPSTPVELRKHAAI